MAVERNYGQVIIEACAPVVDNGRFAAKASVALALQLGADVFAHGHDHLLAWARWGPPRPRLSDPATLPRGWHEQLMTPGFTDRFTTWITPGKVGELSFEVVACVDDFATWLHALRAKLAAQQAVAVEFEEGALLLLRRAKRKDVSTRDRGQLHSLAEILRDESRGLTARLNAMTRPSTGRLMERTVDRSSATVAGAWPIWVDRPLAACSAWYEMFPRSEGSQPPHSGTFQTAARRLSAVAAMGFDIVYLPPIHPIGSTDRKGANNALTATRDDVGSPWAIGGPEGGHDAIHPDLGTLADFDSFVAAATKAGLEVALDYALQCSPDHPWVRQHPEWFRQRPDGSIKFAENPPKQYQDIYPINFETADRVGLWNALRDVLLFWCERGIGVFRVDNPHTKPLNFWEWLIAEVRSRYPGTIFLAEAFTQPRVMHRLAKVGFSQSYTYFTWRNSKWELEEYLAELTAAPAVDYFRPNFWPNTPDILHATLQQGGPAAFRLRLVLAAMAAGSWGIYSGYELCEDQPLRIGSEEYLDSEKFQLRPRNWTRSDSLAPLVRRVNAIRHAHRDAVAQLSTLRMHHIDNPALICFSRQSHDGSDVLLIIVNLDPRQTQEGSTWLDLEALGMSNTAPYEAHDELTDTTYVWQGQRAYVRLDPAENAAHILHLRKRQ